MPDVDFFFDFISPYSYLAQTQLTELAARTGARFKLWPMHLLTLMNIVGNTPTTVLCKNKNTYAGQDIARWSARYGVPFTFNPYLRGADHTLTLRGALAAHDLNQDEQYVRAMFAAFWRDAVHVSDKTALVRHLKAAGLDGSTILTQAENPEYAQRLESNTQVAANRGVFGSPSFIVGEDLFFGNDRLDFLEAELKERKDASHE